MATDFRTKNLIYKRAGFLVPPGAETLQSLLAAALKDFPLPLDRQEKRDPDDSWFNWINFSGNRGRKGGNGQLLGCEFICYTKGANSGAISFAENVNHFAVEALPPPVGKELLEGSVYFGVVDNHVVVLQSAALRTKDLERHLNWFLRNKANVLGENNQVTLEDNIPPEIVDMNDVQGLVLKAPVHFQPDGGDEPISSDQILEMKKGKRKKGANVRAEAESMQVIPVGRAWDAVKAFLGDSFNLPSNMNAEDMLKSGNMRVKLSLSWTNPRGEDAADFVKNVAQNAACD